MNYFTFKTLPDDNSIVRDMYLPWGTFGVAELPNNQYVVFLLGQANISWAVDVEVLERFKTEMSAQ